MIAAAVSRRAIIRWMRSTSFSVYGRRWPLFLPLLTVYCASSRTICAFWSSPTTLRESPSATKAPTARDWSACGGSSRISGAVSGAVVASVMASLGSLRIAARSRASVSPSVATVYSHARLRPPLSFTSWVPSTCAGCLT